ncbi:hypothetical protein PPERSA_02068 [Pseudocohnilembus persalinus]|uniref:Uncharacterized protein n=1 Tax=Pseudocohnilembus persalinus TaxID=266149 RepID=A0A0V0QFC2_PSEPJ|nr:hypothetical protein PPERSA_02068 [Pseudocohnilembus persalinus]|eukprot:KRX00889.1 hypothetical protein PPERSA_02068 [Pseudocohnilembus persalinus]
MNKEEQERQKKKDKVAQLMLVSLKQKHSVLKRKQEEAERDEEEKQQTEMKKTPWRDPKMAVKLNKQTGKFESENSKQKDFQQRSQFYSNFGKSIYNQQQQYQMQQNLGQTQNSNFQNTGEFQFQNNNYGNNYQGEALQQQQLVGSIAKHFNQIIQGITRQIGQNVAINLGQQLQEQNNLIRQISRQNQEIQKKNQYQFEKKAQFLKTSEELERKKQEILDSKITNQQHMRKIQEQSKKFDDYYKVNKGQYDEQQSYQQYQEQNQKWQRQRMDSEQNQNQNQIKNQKQNYDQNEYNEGYISDFNKKNGPNQNFQQMQKKQQNSYIRVDNGNENENNYSQNQNQSQKSQQIQNLQQNNQGEQNFVKQEKNKISGDFSEIDLDQYASEKKSQNQDTRVFPRNQNFNNGFDNQNQQNGQNYYNNTFNKEQIDNQRTQQINVQSLSNYGSELDISSQKKQEANFGKEVLNYKNQQQSQQQLQKQNKDIKISDDNQFDSIDLGSSLEKSLNNNNKNINNINNQQRKDLFNNQDYSPISKSLSQNLNGQDAINNINQEQLVEDNSEIDLDSINEGYIGQFSRRNKENNRNEQQKQQQNQIQNKSNIQNLQQNQQKFEEYGKKSQVQKEEDDDYEEDFEEEIEEENQLKISQSQQNQGNDDQFNDDDDLSSLL